MGRRVLRDIWEGGHGYENRNMRGRRYGKHGRKGRHKDRIRGKQ